jgi:hypothetical protein
MSDDSGLVDLPNLGQRIVGECASREPELRHDLAEQLHHLGAVTPKGQTLEVGDLVGELFRMPFEARRTCLRIFASRHGHLLWLGVLSTEVSL